MYKCFTSRAVYVKYIENPKKHNCADKYTSEFRLVEQDNWHNLL